MPQFDFATVEQFAAESGYTPKAIYNKISKGVWLEGREYRKAPDGRVMVSRSGVEQWVAGNGPQGLSH